MSHLPILAGHFIQVLKDVWLVVCSPPPHMVTADSQMEVRDKLGGGGRLGGELLWTQGHSIKITRKDYLFF